MKSLTSLIRVLSLIGLSLIPYVLSASPVIQGPLVPAIYWRSIGGSNIFYTGGNIGIGVNNPSYLLDVSGTGQFIGFRLPTGAVSNYILASDATGNARWISTGSLITGVIESDPQVGVNTTNYIPKWDGSALVTGQIYDTGTGVGIGTSSPEALLQITSASNVTAILMDNGKGLKQKNAAGVAVNLLQHYFDDNVYLDNPNGAISLRASSSTGFIAFQTSATEKMRIDSNGNVGIGASVALGSKLSFGNQYVDYRNRIALYENDSSSNYFRGIGMVNLGSGFYGVGVWAKGSAIPPSDSNPDLVIRDGGNIGIGTTTPGAPLTIAQEATYTFPNPGSAAKGAINIRATTTNRETGITFSSAAGDSAQAGIYVHQDNAAGTHMYLATTDNYTTGPQARMALLNNGNIGIGTTTPGSKLDVLGELRLSNSATNYIRLIHTGTGGNSHIDTYGTGGMFLNWFAGSGVHIGNGVSNYGSIFAGGYFYASDKSYKTDIKPLENPLDTLLSLEGVSFKWKDTGRSDIGFIAQDVEKVIPEIVATNGQGKKSLEYGNITALTVEAIKEQQKIIEKQKDEIETLKVRLEKLESNRISTK